MDVEVTFKPNDDPCDDLRRERSRLASFWQYSLVPESGVWVMHLAEAGFYCPDKNSAILRCAFCSVEVEIGQFRKRAVREVHRTLSPSCPLVKGEARNQSLEEQNMTANRQYIQAWFGPGGSVDPLGASQGHQGEQTPRIDSKRKKGVEGAAVRSDHPPSIHLNSSGHSPGPCSQTQAQHHRLASAATSVSHPPKTGSSRAPSSTDPTSGALQSAAFPPVPLTSTLCPSAGTGRGNTAGESFAPGGPTEHPGPQTPDQGPGMEPPRQVEPHTSESAHVQNASNSGTSRNTSNPQPFQTARPEERNPERTEPGAGSHTEAAARATAAASSDLSTPSASTNESMRQVVTYAQLGIYTQEPKRPDLAIVSSRVRTYSHWPHEATHSPQDMAEAGFYFVGVEDVVRCFYCKGGLKSWSRSLRPWVEHAHFYPHCPFVGQVKGQEFIEVVQQLKEKSEEISEAQIEEELKKKHSAVLGEDVASDDGPCTAEKRMQGPPQGAEGAMETEGMEGAIQGEDEDDEQADDTHLRNVFEELENANQEINNQRICKICQTEDVSILFLPCGHLVSCSQCAPALRTCAVCRQRVKGRVRVLDDKHYREGDRKI